MDGLNFEAFGDSTEVLEMGSWFSMQIRGRIREDFLGKMTVFFRASFWAHNLNSVVIGYAAVFAAEKKLTKMCLAFESLLSFQRLLK